MTLNTKSAKLIFTLKNINTEEIEKKYGIIFESNLVEKNDIHPNNTTKISELTSSINIISFLDESKKEHICVNSMIDFVSHTNINNTRYNCFWDRNPIPIDIVPIGCPIKFIPSQLVKTYFSEISKDTYIIKENISSGKEKTFDELKDDRIILYKNGFYSTDGAFCSFNCAMSYILTKRHNSIYNQSKMLLLKMYNDMYNKQVQTIIPAPSFRLLNEYGGNLSINKFRDGFNKVEYIKHGFVLSELPYKSVTHLYEEIIKF